MTWPAKLRALSFVIILGVVLMEAAIALLPIGIALCCFTNMDAVRVLRGLAMVALGISIIIAIHGDLGRQGYRKWWRRHA
ncbi:MAG TPA: hypothetical protein VKR29_04585 [Candidatus Binataceae bacterium]|nr:hypothetical protein [Candidatus Binataceae bacterium]